MRKVNPKIMGAFLNGGTRNRLSGYLVTASCTNIINCISLTSFDDGDLTMVTFQCFHCSCCLPVRVTPPFFK